MSLALVDRPPTPEEFERFRLILSTYQDGSGMLAMNDGSTLPGWRDFERTVAAAFNGVAQENKAIFDVLISDAEGKVQYAFRAKCAANSTGLLKTVVSLSSCPTR